MQLTTENIDILEQLALAATPGPWAVDPLGVGARFNIETPDGAECIAMAQQLVADRRNEKRGANADYIAAAHPQIILGLIKLLRAAQAVQDR